MAVDNQLTKFIFEKIGVPSFQKYLTLGSYRHKLISSNISNVSTPGYQAEDIDFQEEFSKMTAQTNHVSGAITNPNHIPLGAHPQRAPRVDHQQIKDGDINSVSIEEQASNLAQNELLYTIGARLIKQRFEGLKNAITSK
ncbi:MAG: flagellar basal body rod protein FlgB [Candidatus Zixiibacteriota bacterium]